MHRREFMTLAPAAAVALHAEPTREARWLEIAESLKPRPHALPVKPVALVKPVEDRSTFLQWRMESQPLAMRPVKRGDSFIVDFGRHMTGTLAFSLEGVGTAVDSPVRLRITFGEAPADVAVPLESYTGELSRGWLPDEVINVDFLPRRVEAPRRHAFRYVKFDVIDTSPNYSALFSNIEATALTSAGPMPAPLQSADPLLRRIDEVSLATLRDCMQTVFEDGPRRDRRLWIGDLRLQAMTNYVTFKNYDLVKRCLYLFAGLPREDGLLAACVYDEPRPLCGRQYIMDYSALYAAALLDYVKASGDTATARDLWPAVARQFEILGAFIGSDGLFRDPGGWWLFVDWRDGLDTLAPMQAILLFCYRQALELAHLAGVKVDYAARIGAMRKAALDNYYDPQRKVFVSGKNRQVSWATQAWMVMAGVTTPEQGAAALRAVAQDKTAVRPGTPYLYHYVTEAMLACGMKTEAEALLREYWGGMVKAGADTFWEVYDPTNPLLSPYKSILVNSYCHAWSCTPAWFLRSGKL